MQKTLEWVVCVWFRLNEGLVKLGLHDHVLGPSVFLACPVHENDIEMIFFGSEDRRARND